MSGLTAENFDIVMLDNRHRVLEIKTLFKGTIDSCSVYPRIVAQECLMANCAAVAFFHNHPSNIPAPSKADIDITSRLKKALTLIDVRVLDSFVVCDGSVVSLTERGEMELSPPEEHIFSFY